MNCKASVVRERQDGYDLQSGPFGYERVGFEIDGRVFWTGLTGSYAPGSETFAADERLAQTIVARWNAAVPAEGEKP